MSQPDSLLSKPLPDLPPSTSFVQSLPKFTPAASAHLKRILNQALVDEQLDIRWLPQLEHALSSFIEAVERGNWLSGARRRQHVKIDFEPYATTVASNKDEGQASGRAAQSGELRKSSNPKNPTSKQGAGDENLRPNQDDPERTRVALVGIDKCIISAHPPMQNNTYPNHMILTVAPLPTFTPFHDLHLNFEIVNHREACTFTPGVFTLPFFEIQPGIRKGRGGYIITGLSGWPTSESLGEDGKMPLNVVGGTFIFKGVYSEDVFLCLQRIMRLGVYAALSLQVELCMLRDNHVRLKYPKPKPQLPKLKPTSGPSIRDINLDTSPIAGTPQSPPTGGNASKRIAGVLGFLSRTTEGLRQTFGQRTSQPVLIDAPPTPPVAKFPPNSPRPLHTPFRPHFPAQATLDLARTFSHHLRLTTSDDAVQNNSLESSPSALRPTFATILSRVAGDQFIYTTSPDVVFLPPSLLKRLAEKEAKQDAHSIGPGQISGRSMRLAGFEKAGLSSILGWSSVRLGEMAARTNLVLGMSGTQAFVRHQSLTVLYAEHVPAQEEPAIKDLTAPPLLKDSHPSPNSSETNTGHQTGERDSRDTQLSGEYELKQIASSDSTQAETSSAFGKQASDSPLASAVPCQPARWRTYRYYSSTLDESLGNFLLDQFNDALEGKMCSKEGCGRSRVDHGLDWINGGVRVTGVVSMEVPEESDDFDKEIWMWSSCKVCKRKTTVVRMSDPTFLCSFAKYLELLIYSPTLASPTLSLCEHCNPRRTRSSSTTDSVRSRDTNLPVRPHPLGSLSATRFNVSRHFRYKNCSFTFVLAPLDSTIFEIKVPQLQIIKNIVEVKRSSPYLRENPTPRNSNEMPREDGPRILPEDEEQRSLRLEITYWWKALKEHLDKLENYIMKAQGISDVKIRNKRLPSIPNDGEMNDDDATPTVTTTRSEHTTTTKSSESQTIRDETNLATPTARSLPLPETSPTTSVLPARDPLVLLDNLRRAFLLQEQSLYAALPRTPTHMVNDIRRDFTAKAKAALRRTAAWQRKHTPIAKDDPDVGEVDCQDSDPEWWNKGVYVPPGSRVLVRENDWGSIIAFSLSTTEYKKALTEMIFGQNSSQTNVAETPTPSVSTEGFDNSTSYFSSQSLSDSQTSSSRNSTERPPTSRLSSSQTVNQPDPDCNDVPISLWYTSDAKNHQSDMFSGVATRRDHPRDTAGILGLRDVLRHQRSVETGQGAGPKASRFTSLSNSASKFVNIGGQNTSNAVAGVPTPPSAWSKAAVEVSMRPAEGELTAGDGSTTGSQTGLFVGIGAERLAEIVQQVERREGVPFEVPSAESGSIITSSSAFTLLTSLSTSPSTGSQIAASQSISPSPSGFENTSSKASSQITEPGRKSGLPSTITTSTSRSTVLSTVTHSPEPSDGTITPPPVPSKDRDSEAPDPQRATHSSPSATASSKASGMGTSAANTGSITSTIASAMRFVLNPLGSTGLNTSAPVAGNHLGLLALGPFDPNAPFASTNSSPRIDAKPHIKYDFTVGKQLKFSCTIYYARQFDMLRRRCSVVAGDAKVPPPKGSNESSASNDDIDIVRSLERCVGWEAEGGKSKSSFLKSEDDRFIIKTLVNAWNVADLQVLLEMAPSYFRYMDQTASHASVLAKLMGFFTIEIKNLETGQMKAKVDLLVMENLFFGMNVTPGRSFDLKGIAGRKVKLKSQIKNTIDDKAKPPEVETPRKSGNPPGQNGRTGAQNSGPRPSHKPLFDGEWIEGQQRSRILVEPHSKAILKEAIKGDAEFLAKSNIMDYSLLLGIDEEKRQIACGLVDTIGSYTFAKTLEYKAKQGLAGNSGREVTVVPPAEYQQRFVNAMESYFLACPEKWSKPLPQYGDPSKIEDLPDIF